MATKTAHRNPGGYVYSLAEDGFRIVNGGEYFNRPLYGTHARDADSIDDSVLVVAGDMPQIIHLLLRAQQGGKGGVLSLGVIAGEGGKWLHEFDRIVATYDPGVMRYRLEDALLGQGHIALEVVPLIDTEGFMARVSAEAIATPMALVWTYGGLSAFGPRGSHFDYRTLEHGAFELEDYAGNVFELDGSTFRLRAPEKNPAKVFQGRCSFSGRYQIADARMLLKSPEMAVSPEGQGDYPLLMHVSPIEASSFEGHILVAREAGDGFRAEEADPDQTFDQCVAHYRGIARRAVIETPDPYLNKGMEALCLAMDACWHHPTFMHGAWSWHEPYLGWRAWYGGDALGWHDRVRTAIRAHAATQIKEPVSIQPTWSGRHGYAAGGDTKGGLPSMLSGEITHVFYNMVEIYLDHVFYHYQWTGDLDFMREVFPTISDALFWERRTFDANDDGLYENWLNTWISDAHWYNGGGCIQSSAYNWRANAMAAEVAERLGIDPTPFLRQAEKIKQAVDEILWLPKKGIYAEYKDAVGLERLHESPELPSIYHPIDFYLTDDFQAYQMLRFTEYRLKNEYQTPRGGRLIWSSDWEPPLYSSHGLYPQEVLNTLLCYYRIGQTEEAQKLLNGCVASWYMGPVPGGIAHNIRPDGEHFGSTDFSDTVSIFCRSIVEGLFGILPRMQDHTITIMPGFPRRWTRARIRTPDIACEYERQGLQETVRATTSAPTKKILKMIARWDKVRQVQVNGRDADFAIVPGIGQAYVVVETPLSTTAEIVIHYRRTKPAKITFSPTAACGERYTVGVKGGEIAKIHDPQGVLQEPALTSLQVQGMVRAPLGHHTFFVLLKKGDMTSWHPVDVEVREVVEVAAPMLELAGPPQYCLIPLEDHYNDYLEEIHQHEFRSPRPSTYSIMTTLQGRPMWDGNLWGYGKPPIIDDSTLRGTINATGCYVTKAGIPFRQVVRGKNVAVVSIWDNFPTSITVPLQRKGHKLYLLIAGSTHPMQSRIANGRIVVRYEDGAEQVLDLVNPQNFDDLITAPYHHEGVTETIGNNTHAIILDVVLHRNKAIRELEVSALSNEVLIGLLGVTLLDEN